MGVDVTGDHFKLEQQAINEASFRVPDQAGWQPHKQRIDDHPGLTITPRLLTDLDVTALAGVCMCVGTRAKLADRLGQA